MTWIVEPILLRGEHRGGWYVVHESGPDALFEARNESEALILAHVLNEAGLAGWCNARDGALRIFSARHKQAMEAAE